MIQQRKKDFLQKLIEEFFSKFQELIRSSSNLTDSEKREFLDDGFRFFSVNFEVKQSDTVEVLIQRINDAELLQQYAKLLMLEHETAGSKDVDSLYKALDIVEYLETTDKTYSWERTVLREDLLRLLNEEKS